MLGMLWPSARNATTSDRRRYPLASDWRRKIVLTSCTVPGLVLVAEDRLPLPAVLTCQADLGDALREEPLALGVLPQHGFQLVEGVQHLV